MKLKLLRWLLPAIVPAALMFGAASPAHAVSYNCDGPINPVPANPPGSVEIELNNGEDCVIDHDVVAQGSISIKAFGGKITTEKLTSVNGNVTLYSANKKIKTKKISAGTVVKIQTGINGGTTASAIDVGDIVSNTLNTQSVTENGNIYLQAWGPISTKDIKTTGTLGPQSKRSGAVQIDAFMGGSSTLFTIGMASDNGINGTIDTRSLDGGGFDTGLVESGIRITNGTTESTGGITVTAMNNIKVRNSNSRSGQIELNAWKGTLTLPGGELDVSEQNAKGAGFIFLLGKTLVTQDNTKIKANQADGSAGKWHQVVIAAETIQFQGDGGLVISADGNGITESQTAAVYVTPQGGVTSTSIGDVNNLHWTRTFTNGFFKHPGAVHFVGSPTTPLILSANGNNSQVAITGYPLTFTAGDLTIRARGSNIKHEVVMGYFGTATGNEGITFNTKKVLVTTQAKKTQSGDGGDIQVQTPGIIALNAQDHEFNASGPDSGSDGNGGTIYFAGLETNLSEQGAKAKFFADASESGGGNAQLMRNGRKAILFFHGNSDIRIASQAFRFSADGGLTSGDAGAIEITSFEGKVVVKNSEGILSASARSPSGKGGDIKISSLSVKLDITENIPGLLRPIRAEGGTDNGAGGKVDIVTAKGPDSNTPINLDASIKVDSGPNANELGVFHGSVTMNDSPIVLNTPIVCTRYKNNTDPYPNSYWYCGVQPTKSLLVMNTIRGMFVPSLEKLDDYDAPVFVFASIQDYNAFLDDDKVTEIPGVRGFTLIDEEQKKIVVLEAQGTPGGGGYQLDADSLIQFTARHEAGHVLDLQFSSEVGRSFVSLPGGDLTQSYDSKLEHDFRNLTFEAPGYINLKPACGPGAIFEGQIDPRTTSQQICPLQGDLVGKNNREILETLFPYFLLKKPDDQGNIRWFDTWPEQTATYSGPAGDKRIEYYFQNYFPCSKKYVDALLSTGVLADSSTYPAECTD